MSLALTIDLEKAEVSVQRNTNVVWRAGTAQWVEFYCRLKFARDVDPKSGWVTSAELAELGGWSAKKPRSVGKEVSRHVDKVLAVNACVVEAPHPTVQWRLSLPRNRVKIKTSGYNLEDWLRDRGMGIQESQVPLDWLSHIVRAFIAYGSGQLVVAEKEAWSALRIDGLDAHCRRLAGLMVMRVVAGRNRVVLVRDTVEKLVAGSNSAAGLTEEALWGHGALGAYIRARLSTLQAIDSGHEQALDLMTPLQHRLGRAAAGGNLASQVVLNNTLGLLAWRARQYHRARYYLTNAIFFAVGVGDLFSLGGAIFNMALTVLNEGNNIVANVALARQFLSLGVEMDRTLAVGKVSAQAEILLARLDIYEGNWEAAQEALLLAETMVGQSGSPYDSACLCVARAKLHWGQSLHPGADQATAARQARRLLNQAKLLLQESGRQSSHIENDLESLRAGRGLSLSPQG